MSSSSDKGEEEKVFYQTAETEQQEEKVEEVHEEKKKEATCGSCCSCTAVKEFLSSPTLEPLRKAFSWEEPVLSGAVLVSILCAYHLIKRHGYTPLQLILLLFVFRFGVAFVKSGIVYLGKLSSGEDYHTSAEKKKEKDTAEEDVAELSEQIAKGLIFLKKTWRVGHSQCIAKTACVFGFVFSIWFLISKVDELTLIVLSSVLVSAYNFAKKYFPEQSEMARGRVRQGLKQLKHKVVEVIQKGKGSVGALMKKKKKE